jgi:hypothetical protein
MQQKTGRNREGNFLSKCDPRPTYTKNYTSIFFFFSVHGKKGKVMERRILKDFQIGFVEGVVNEALSSDKGSKDVFTKIANAIGKRKTITEKKDWNAEAKRRNSQRELIGTTSELTHRRQSQQSLRRYIIENQSTAMQTLDPNKLIEYNPRLRDVSPATRVAYTKFKMRKIKEEYEKDDPEEETADDTREVHVPPNGHVASQRSTASQRNLRSLIKTQTSLRTNVSSIISILGLNLYFLFRNAK